MGQSPPRPFGPLLRAHRHTAGLTLDELAAASKVTARAIGDMERGHSRGPQSRTVQALADALGLARADTDALLTAARAGRRRHTAPPGLCELPSGTPDFAGRAEELRRLGEESAGADGGSVVVVHGAPGLGKTALVAQAARERSVRHAGGCLFVNLRGLDAQPLTPYDAQARLLRALGVADGDLPTGADDRAALYLRTVRDADVLLVLDNAAGESQVLPLLPGPGAGPAWVTSRRALTGLPDAHRIALTPLPESAATSLLAAITARRTAAVNAGAGGGTHPTDPAARQERDALTRIAELCGGLPLALRIAGNRLVTRPGWTASALADRLAAEDHRLTGLTAGDLAVRSAFTLSYEQLTDPARALFRRLALVTGPDFAPVLGAVLTGSPLERVEDLTDELVELGLLGQDSAGRASFHDLIRLYARHRLDAEESLEARQAAGTALRTWLLRTARAAGSRFEPGDAPAVDPAPPADVGDQQTAQQWLRTEHAHWLTALREAAAAGDHATVVDVAESMHWFSDRWPFWGHWHEVFALSRDAAHALGDLTAEATQANYLSWAYFHCRHDPDTGSRLALEAAELARRAGDTVQEAWAYTYAAHTAVTRELFEPAVTYARRAEALFAAAGNREGHPTALVVLARSLRSIGRFEDAVDTLDRLLALLADPATAPAEHIADYSTMNALCGKARALIGLGRWADARLAAQRALEVDVRVDVPVLRGQALLCAARALAGLGERASALTTAHEALAAAQLSGDATQREEAEELITLWTTA
ncbi:ATP-binding protein [Streptomyces griseoviridis]